MVETVRKVGFVQSLFNGKIEKDLLKPYPAYGDEEREEMFAIIDMIKRFAKDQIDPVKIDREHFIPDSVKEGMKELGLWGLIIPEEYDGFAQPEILYNKAMEILTGTCGSTAVMYGSHLSIGLKAILLFGNDDQKRRFLPDLATGKKLAGFALTEPGAGSDVASIRTTAVPTDDGKYYILNGRKQWITNGGFAEVFTVYAKVRKPGEEMDTSKITAFVITRDMEGFSSGKEEDKLGLCGSSTTSLFLDNVKVPAENILGEIGHGFKIAMDVLDTGRLGLGAGCVGTAKAILQHALKYALQREQFRKSISEYDMIKEKFSRILINTFTGESMVYFTTSLRESPNIPVGVESAICKTFSSEALWQTVNDCLQVAGGNGLMKEYPYERFLRDSRINMIFEGTNEILRMFIAVSGLMQPSIHLKKYQKTLPGETVSREKEINAIFEELSSTREDFAIEGFSDKLRDQTDTASNLAQRFYEVVTKAVLRHGRDIREMQFIQRRLADAVIDLYGIFANCARTEKLIRNEHHTAGKAVLISRIFSRQAEDRINRNLDEVESNDDDALSEIAGMLYESEEYPFDILDY